MDGQLPVHTVIQYACRCKEADVTSYFSQSLSEDTISHLRLYKKALDNTPGNTHTASTSILVTSTTYS